jgi:D-sedoheptulose 7-phosphate isomerase
MLDAQRSRAAGVRPCGGLAFARRPNDDLIERATGHVWLTIAIQKLVARRCIPALVAAAQMVAEAFATGHKLLLCGNGGSAADCQHVAAEFVSRLRADFERPALPAVALTTDTSFLTAFANDCGYEGIFARQVEALGQSGDVLLAISTSGRSGNVARAIAAASATGVWTVGLFGEGGRLEGDVDVAITVPSRDTQVVQECMLSIEHILCELVEDTLFGHLRRSVAEAAT